MQNSTKLATSLPLMVRVRESNIIFSCVRPSVRRPSICLSRYLLLNLWTEFNQTCYISSLYGKGVQEQHCLSVRSSLYPSSVSLYVTLLLLNHWAEFNKSCHITSPHGKGVRKQYYFPVSPSVHASVVRPSVRHAITS